MHDMSIAMRVFAIQPMRAYANLATLSSLGTPIFNPLRRTDFYREIKKYSFSNPIVDKMSDFRVVRFNGTSYEELPIPILTIYRFGDFRRRAPDEWHEMRQHLVDSMWALPEMNDLARYKIFYFQ